MKGDLPACLMKRFIYKACFINVMSLPGTDTNDASSNVARRKHPKKTEMIFILTEYVNSRDNPAIENKILSE
jgi:hypothetical protein